MMKYIRLLVFLCIGFVVVGSALGYFVIRVKAQEDIITYLTERLTGEGIPLKSIEAQSQIPFTLEITLQRIDEQNKHLEPFYVHAVKREVTLARERGFGVNKLTLVILNTNGGSEYWTTEPIEKIAVEKRPSELTDDEVASQVLESLELFGLNLDRVEVGSDQYNAQIVSLQLRVVDIETVNEILPQFMPSLRTFFERLNKDMSTKIGVCRLELRDEKNQPLLDYVLDLQLDQETWWMAEGVTMDWFPHPLPPLPDDTEDSVP